MTRPKGRSSPLAAKLRRGRLRDIDELIAIEHAVFTTDILSRRSFRRFLTGRNATAIVAEESGKVAGYALVLYPPQSTFARLYSIAVAPHIGRQQAHDVVYDACRLVNERGGSLSEALVANPKISGRIDQATIDRLTTPRNYLGQARQMVDRVLASVPRGN